MKEILIKPVKRSQSRGQQPDEDQPAQIPSIPIDIYTNPVEQKVGNQPVDCRPSRPAIRGVEQGDKR